LVLVVLPYP